jgi:hypothetical protein
MKNSQAWYVVIQGKANGPHTEEDMHAKLEKNEIAYSDLAFRTGLSQWIPISQCKEFERRLEVQLKAPTPQEIDTPMGKDITGWVLLVNHPINSNQTHYLQSGPYRTEQILKKLSAGEIKYEDYIWKEGFTNWQVISEFEEFNRRVEVAEPEVIGCEVNASESTAPAPMLTPLAIKIRESKFQRVAIAVSGSLLGMLVTLAGVRAYQQSKVLEQAPKLLKPALQTQANHTNAVVNPESEVRVAKKTATVLKMLPFKHTAKNPQVAFETDLPQGAKITVMITAQPGNILKYPSFALEKKIEVKAGQLPVADFTNENLPRGTYFVSVESENLKAAGSFLVGDNDSDFKKKLLVFRKQVSKQEHTEKLALNQGVKFLNESIRFFAKVPKNSKLSAEANAKWLKAFRSWNKHFKEETKFFKEVTESKRNAFAYPNELLKLKELETRLKEQANNFNLKDNRQIASDDSSISAIKNETKSLQQNIKNLK